MERGIHPCMSIPPRAYNRQQLNARIKAEKYYVIQNDLKRGHQV